MFEDPQDMSRQMDGLFFSLYARLNRDFSAGEPQASGNRILLRQGDVSPAAHDMPEIRFHESSMPVAEDHRLGNEVKAVTGTPGTAEERIGPGVQGSTRIMQTSFKNGVLPGIPEPEGSHNSIICYIYALCPSLPFIVGTAGSRRE